MDSIDIEQLTKLGIQRKGQPTDERILALNSQEQDYLSHLAILIECITPEDMAVFLELCDFQLSTEELMHFLKTGLSQYVIAPGIVEGDLVPIFQIEDSVRKYYRKQLIEAEMIKRHECADRFYRHIFAELVREINKITSGNKITAPDETLTGAIIGTGGLIDFGAHNTQSLSFHAWSVSRAFCWQQHLFELRKFNEAADITNSICFAMAREGHSKLAQGMLTRDAAVNTGLQKTAALINLATLLRETQEHEKALRLYRKCVWPLIRLRASRQLAAVFSEMSNVYRDRGQWAKALIFQQLSNLLRSCLKDLKGKAICNNQLSILYRSLGKHKLAVKCSQSAENYWRSAQDEVNLAKTMVTQGNLFNIMGNPQKALSCFEEGLAINTRIGNLSESASAMSGKARAYLQLHNYEQAKALLEEAISLRWRNSDHSIGIEYQNMGNLYELKGDSSLALGWYQKALPLLQQYYPVFAPDCQKRIAVIQERLKPN